MQLRESERLSRRGAAGPAHVCSAFFIVSEKIILAPTGMITYALFTICSYYVYHIMRCM